ncbi:hypothetical protein [Streptomyces sp. S3(2020)]|nr:hypothetical protein [Streptomyces sp. S3(2020)]
MDNDVTCAAFDQKSALRDQRSMEAFTAPVAWDVSAVDEAAKRRL